MSGPDPVATADQEDDFTHYFNATARLTAKNRRLADERDRAHATLREIAPVLDAAADQAAALNEPGMSGDLDAAYRLVRERLENP